MEVAGPPMVLALNNNNGGMMIYKFKMREPLVIVAPNRGAVLHLLLVQQSLRALSLWCTW